MAHKDDKAKSRLSQVASVLGIAVTFVLIFDARGLHRWVSSLPPSPTTDLVRPVIQLHWWVVANLGLETPQIWVENAFLDFKGAHPLDYPRTLAQIEKIERRGKMALAAKAAPASVHSNRNKRKQRHPPSQGGRAKRSASGGPSVLLVGDSIMVNIGPVITRDLRRHLDSDALLKAKISTGLARPDVFDWHREVRLATSRKVWDYMVIMLGTNDSQDFYVHGKRLGYGTREWVEEYNQRLASLLEIACQGSRRVVWLGLPPMRSRRFHRKIVRLNHWVKKRVSSSGCGDYIPTDKIVGDATGNYVGYRNWGNKMTKVRTVDGIHITRKGGKIISQLLMDKIRNAL